jgi:hypothetical protein
MTVGSTPRCVEPTQHDEFNADKYSVKDFDGIPNLQHPEHVADLESQPAPPPLPGTETNPGASSPQSNYIAEPWERDTQGCLQTNLQNNSYYGFEMCVEYKYTQCGIKKKGMKMYYDNIVKEQNTAQHFPSFNNGDRV